MTLLFDSVHDSQLAVQHVISIVTGTLLVNVLIANTPLPPNTYYIILHFVTSFFIVAYDMSVLSSRTLIKILIDY